MSVPFQPWTVHPQPSQYTHHARPVQFKPCTVYPPTHSLHPLRYAGSIQTLNGPHHSPVNTPTTLGLFRSNPGRPIPQASQYTHYAMLVPFKPRTVHPPAQSIHPLSYAGSIQTLNGPHPSPVNTPTMVCRFHSNLDGPSPAQSLYPPRYACSVQTLDGTPPAQSIQPLRYAGSIQIPDFQACSQVSMPTTQCGFHSKPDDSSPSRVNPPSTICLFHSIPGRSISQHRYYTH